MTLIILCTLEMFVLLISWCKLCNVNCVYSTLYDLQAGNCYLENI